MVISSHDVILLPLHDADFLGLTFKPDENGFITVLLKATLHPDEAFEYLERFGITGSTFYLVFRDCIRIKSKMFGHAEAPETISHLILIEESDLKEKLLADGFTVNAGSVHFKLTGSKGSEIDILTTNIVITDKIEVLRDY